MDSFRVWVVSELYFPEETSTGYYLTRIAERLAADVPVGVICSQPTYSARGTRAPVREERNGVRIQRCRGTTLNKDFLLFRMANSLTFAISVFFNSLIRFRRRDVVLVVTNPPVLPFAVMGACRWRGARIVLLIHDVYPEALEAARMIRPASFISRFISLRSRKLLDRADRIVVLGRDMAALVTRKSSVPPSRVVTVSNWADTEEIRPSAPSQNELLRRLGLEGKFVFQYSGNMGRTHDLETLLACARVLKTDPRFHLLLIGAGAKRQAAEKTALGMGLDNVTFLPPVSRRELPVSLNACHVAVVSLVPGMAGVSVPSRIYNIMAAGKPIIALADEDSEPALVVREERIGWVSPPGKVAPAVAAIKEALENPGKLIEMGLRARTASERSYSREAVLDRYRNVIEEMRDGG